MLYRQIQRCSVSYKPILSVVKTSVVELWPLSKILADRQFDFVGISEFQNWTIFLFSFNLRWLSSKRVWIWISHQKCLTNISKTNHHRRGYILAQCAFLTQKVNNIFHVFSIDFEAFFVPSKHEKTRFSLRKTALFAKSPFGEKHDFLIDFIIIFGTIFLQIWHRFSILFRYRFLGHIFTTFFDFWCHYRRPRGPTGDLRDAIFG